MNSNDQFRNLTAEIEAAQDQAISLAPVWPPEEPAVEYDDDPDFHPVSGYRAAIAERQAVGEDVPQWMFDHADQDERKARMICQNCHQRRSTLDWVGDGGALALTHGWSKRWCDHCALSAQIDHAQAMAAKLPELQAKLAALQASEAEKS